jgi:hypothetical protein
VIDVEFVRTGPQNNDAAFVLLKPQDSSMPMYEIELPANSGYARLPRIGMNKKEMYNAAWLVYADTSDASSSSYRWNVQIRDLDPFEGPWTQGFEASPTGYKVIRTSESEKAEAAVHGIRISEVKINGHSYTSYSQFESWATQWIRDELAKEKEDGNSSSVSASISSGISFGLMLYVIPGFKMLYDGMPFAMAAELIDENLYLPVLPGLTEEDIQKLKTNKGAPPLQMHDGTTLSGTWNLSDKDDDGEFSLEWNISLIDDDAIEYTAKIIGAKLSPKDKSKNAIHSIEVAAGGTLFYQNIPHGETAFDQKYVDALKEIFMHKLEKEKIKTDAVLKPIIDSFSKKPE